MLFIIRTSLSSCEILFSHIILLGIEEARAAGKILKQNGYEFDAVYTSLLTRAIMTYNNVADELGCHYLPVTKHWRLNERHYGALQGLNKAETAEKHGEE